MSVSEWREVRIGDIGDVVTGKTPSSKNPEYFGDEIPFVTPTDYKNYHKNIYSSERYLSQAGKEVLGNKLLPINSVIVTCIGSDMGKVAINKVECITNQQINSIILKRDLADSDFIYYTLISMQEYLKMLARGGTTMPIVNKSTFEEIKLLLPPFPEQKAIAATLSALDDMIELNNQIKKTLEEMAQAIFKSWFVDFEPFKNGEFEESELGLIPKGWRVGVLEDIAFINTETINPQNYPETFFEHFSIPLFDEGKFSAFEKGEVIKSNKYVIDSSCMLFSKLNPQFKRVFRPFCKTSKAICSTEFMVYKAKKPIYNNYIYSTLCSGSFHQFVMQNVTGTTNSRQRAIPKNTLNFKMLIPDENALSSYNQIISGIFNIMQRIPEDNKLLSSIRDTILPKLMSGEIRVPVEEVI